MSFMEWTARWISRANSASSISLVNSPLPPISDSGRSRMRVTIAAQACLPLLGAARGVYPDLRQVLLYPGAFVVQRPVNEPGGVQSDQRRVLAGEFVVVNRHLVRDLSALGFDVSTALGRLGVRIFGGFDRRALRKWRARLG